MCRTIEKHTISSKKSIQIVGGDFNAELGPGDGVERVSVGPHTQRGEQKRRLVETVADDTQLHSTQHDVQKNAWQEKTLEIQQMCHGNIRDQCKEEELPTR